MSLSADELRHIFDDVMRTPESSRGMHVEETCRLLAEQVKKVVPVGDYAPTMRQLEALYMDQFIHTCITDPTFARSIRSAILRFL